MQVQKLTLILFLCYSAFALQAQESASMVNTSTGVYSPADKWEVGIHAGVPMIIGDIDPGIGFGGGLHIRKSLDHIFSVRASVLYAQTSSEDTDRSVKRSADMNWLSGSGQLVVTLNNIRFNKPYRKILVNGFLGAGLNRFDTDFKNVRLNRNTNDLSDGNVKEKLNGNLEGGVNVSFRLSPNMNLSLEHTAYAAFGAGADRLDGDENVTGGRTTYRDILHYPHVSLNFNLGGKTSAKSEPLYWVNPMLMYNDAIANLEARPQYDPTDTDGDGIIDAIDQEKDSPAGAQVDTRGVTLDSDGDGVANYKDKEPYSPPGYKVDGMGVAQVPVEPKLTEADVNRIVDAKLANFKLPAQRSLVNWFLPMINFDLDKYTVKRSEYSKLYQVAQVMEQNPDLRVVVRGYTDKTATDRYNNVLSYNRAKSAIEFLVANYGVSRDRLILQWGGEDKTIVSTNAQNYTNRRVEFTVAQPGDTEMGRPEGPNAGSGRMSGNRDAGY